MEITARFGVLGLLLLSWFGSVAQGASIDVRAELRKVLNDTHRTVIDYTAARRLIVGPLHVESDSAGNYFVRDVYCQQVYQARASDGAVIEGGMNVEHTWPQSRFVNGSQRWMMKSDLHHLYPAESHANGYRGNHKFGEIRGEEHAISCSASRMGSAPDGSPRFEPPNAHKGNVARALFYYAVHYGARIDQDEEQVLRAWHEQDPVDQAEMARNNAIEKIQGNRNPFIDHPEYVNMIGDF